MKLEITNRTKKRIEKTFIKRVVQKTLDISEKGVRHFSLSVVFAGKKEIQLINRTYRKKNEATDVLSFNYSSGYNKEKIGGQPAVDAALLAGELFLCPEMIEKSAKEHKVSFQKELAFVLSHGILHLLGMKHGKKMYEMQDKVLYELRI